LGFGVLEMTVVERPYLGCHGIRYIRRF
jgi:hypothetical protein